MTYALDDKPKRKELRSLEIDGEIVLHIPEQEQVYVLNPSACLIWNLCDGSHSLEEMRDALAEQFSLTEELDLFADIRETLEAFQNKGLLEET